MQESSEPSGSEDRNVMVQSRVAPGCPSESLVTQRPFLSSDRGRVVGGLPDVVTIMEQKVRRTIFGLICFLLLLDTNGGSEPDPPA